MVHICGPSIGACPMSPDDAWKLSGYSRLRPLSHMKNFVRLVQFAWRYRVRFGLSIGCAAMVALLFFTELGAVYPLLHILFDSQNPTALGGRKRSRPSKTKSSSWHARSAEARIYLNVARKQTGFRDAQTRYQALHRRFRSEKETALELQRHRWVSPT